MNNDRPSSNAKPAVGNKGSMPKPAEGKSSGGAPRSDVKARLKARWNKLSDADLAIIDSRHEALPGLLVTRHALSREQAEKDSKAFFGETHPKGGTSGSHV